MVRKTEYLHSEQVEEIEKIEMKALRRNLRNGKAVFDHQPKLVAVAEGVWCRGWCASSLGISYSRAIISQCYAGQECHWMVHLQLGRLADPSPLLYAPLALAKADGPSTCEGVDTHGAVSADPFIPSFSLVE